MRHTIETRNDELVKEYFTFYVNDRLEMYLDEYYLQTRQTKRHKFKIEKRYKRIMNRGYGETPYEKVPITDAIINVAKQDFISKMCFIPAK